MIRDKCRCLGQDLVQKGRDCPGHFGGTIRMQPMSGTGDGANVSLREMRPDRFGLLRGATIVRFRADQK